MKVLPGATNVTNGVSSRSAVDQKPKPEAAGFPRKGVSSPGATTARSASERPREAPFAGPGSGWSWFLLAPVRGRPVGLQRSPARPGSGISLTCVPTRSLRQTFLVDRPPRVRRLGGQWTWVPPGRAHRWLCSHRVAQALGTVSGLAAAKGRSLLKDTDPGENTPRAWGQCSGGRAQVQTRQFNLVPSRK